MWGCVAFSKRNLPKWRQPMIIENYLFLQILKPVKWLLYWAEVFWKRTIANITQKSWEEKQGFFGSPFQEITITGLCIGSTFKGLVHYKWKFCHQLLSLMSFQTHKTSVHLWNSNEEHLMKSERFLLLQLKSMHPKRFKTFIKRW